jgi:TfoX/Sxy family transcriptional regulator of competence genes
MVGTRQYRRIMAYDEELADRIRALVAARHDVSEKKMFGGLAFLVNGNMAVAASGQGGLLVRCDPARSDDHMVDGAEPMVMRGKPMTGWLRVTDELVASDPDLERWVTTGCSYADGLPPK